ncbi:MAG: LLM class flavin-dependent oxidoreductase [Promethearchaeota archaeon]
MDVKFGIQHGANVGTLGLKTKDYIKSIAFAEKMGYDSTFIWDHLNATDTKEVPSCNVLLPIAALETKNIKIGSCVCDSHRRHPAQIALDSLTLQKLSGNRFILGLGAGEAMNLNDFGINWNKPVSRLIESLEVIKELWKTTQSRDITVNYSGKFFSLNNARLQYSIKQLPEIWLAANGPRLIEFTGKYADGWIPSAHNAKLYEKNLKILGKAGRLDEIEKACEVFVVISRDNPELARQMAQMGGLSISVNPYILEDLHIKIPDNIVHGRYYKETMKELENKEKEKEITDFAKENIPQDIIDSMVISGSPEECIEQIDEYIKAGVEHFLIEVWGVGKYFQALELFTDTVFSYFKESSNEI